MSKVKDENHYKKLYRKLKDTYPKELNKLLQELDVFHSILTVLVKSGKSKKIVISLEDVKNVKEGDRLTREIKKNGDIVFELKK